MQFQRMVVGWGPKPTERRGGLHIQILTSHKRRGREGCLHNHAIFECAAATGYLHDRKQRVAAFVAEASLHGEDLGVPVSIPPWVGRLT